MGILDEVPDRQNRRREARDEFATT